MSSKNKKNKKSIEKASSNEVTEERAANEKVANSENKAAASTTNPKESAHAEQTATNEHAAEEQVASKSERGEFHKQKKRTKTIVGSMIWVVIILAIASLAYYMTQRQDFQQKTANTTTTQELVPQ